jgi:hypothetical protein
MNGRKLERVDSWVYLGVTILSDKMFNCSVTDRIKTLYKCTNIIFRVEGRCDDIIMFSLIESHCISILTYAIEIIHVADSSARRKLRVAYNSVFRKIFGYRYHESVREL